MNRRSYTSAPLSLAQVSAKAVHICPDAGAPLLLSGGGGRQVEFQAWLEKLRVSDSYDFLNSGRTIMCSNATRLLLYPESL